MPDKQSRLLWIALIILCALVLLCVAVPRILVFVAYGNAMSAFGHPQAESRHYRRERTRFVTWQQTGASINPLLFDYYTLHPERFSFPHGDDEAQADGFAEYVRAHGIKLTRGHIVDPWGDPVRYVVDRDRDLALRARGQFYAVGYQRPDRVAVGLLLHEPERASTGKNEQWSLTGGYIPIQ